MTTKEPNKCALCNTPTKNTAITSTHFTVIHLCDQHMKELFDDKLRRKEKCMK